jgi:hypothetical protein
LAELNWNWEENDTEVEIILKYCLPNKNNEDSEIVESFIMKIYLELGEEIRFGGLKFRFPEYKYEIGKSHRIHRRVGTHYPTTDFYYIGRCMTSFERMAEKEAENQITSVYKRCGVLIGKRRIYFDHVNKKPSCV